MTITQRLPDDAPFRSYKKTDEEARQEGYERGLVWPAAWDYVPGGPWTPQPTPVDHGDWVEYCRLRLRHNALWISGWHQGVREAAKKNKALRRMLNRLVLNKLSG